MRTEKSEVRAERNRETGPHTRCEAVKWLISQQLQLHVELTHGAVGAARLHKCKRTHQRCYETDTSLLVLVTKQKTRRTGWIYVENVKVSMCRSHLVFPPWNMSKWMFKGHRWCKIGLQSGSKISRREKSSLCLYFACSIFQKVFA